MAKLGDVACLRFTIIKNNEFICNNVAYDYLCEMLNQKINWDAMGVAASIACAIHCAVLPLVLTSLPLFGIEIIHNILFEYGMILLAFLVGVYSLYHGWKKHHHNWKPLIIFSAGIIFLLMKQIAVDLHIWFLIPAVILIITAHYYNYQFCRLHNHAHRDDCNH